MTHGSHPDIHEAGLADGCERCAEQAQDPLGTLDRDVIRDLWKRTLAFHFQIGGDMGHDGRPRSEAEAEAMGVMAQVAAHLRACHTRKAGIEQVFDAGVQLIALTAEERTAIAALVEGVDDTLAERVFDKVGNATD